MDGLTTPPPHTGAAPHLLGLLYVALLMAATAGGLAASFGTTSGMNCPDPNTTAAVILSCVVMTLIPAVSILPGVRERIRSAYRTAALVVPISAFAIYGAIMIAAAMFSASGERPGSWSGMLMPIVSVAPLATLVGAGIVATLAKRPRTKLYLAIGVLLVVIASLTMLVAVTRSLSLCA